MLASVLAFPEPPWCLAIHCHSILVVGDGTANKLNMSSQLTTVSWPPVAGTPVIGVLCRNKDNDRCGVDFFVPWLTKVWIGKSCCVWCMDMPINRLAFSVRPKLGWFFQIHKTFLVRVEGWTLWSSCHTSESSEDPLISISARQVPLVSHILDMLGYLSMNASCLDSGASCFQPHKTVQSPSLNLEFWDATQSCSILWHCSNWW